MAKKRLNKKLLAILFLFAMSVLVVGVILAIQYKFRDPQPFMDKGLSIIEELPQLEAEIEAQVAKIKDVEEAFKLRKQLQEEILLPKWQEASGALGSVVQYARRNRTLARKALKELGDLYLHSKQYRNALKIWTAMYERDEQDYEARRNIVDFYYELAKNSPRASWHQAWTEIKTQSEYLISLRSDDVFGYALKAQADIMLVKAGATEDPEGLLAQADDLLAKAYKLDEKDLLMHEMLAELALQRAARELDEYKKNELITQAEAYLREGIAKNPDDPQAYENLFDVYLGPTLSEKYQAAQGVASQLGGEELRGQAADYAAMCMEEIDKAIESFPDYSEFYAIKARLYRGSDPPEIIKLYEKAITCQGAQGGLYLELANVYRLDAEQSKDRRESLKKAFSLLREGLYHPDVNDLEGPRQMVARSVRFNIIRVLINLAATLAEEIPDEAEKARYLSIGHTILNELRDSLGSEHFLTKIAMGTMAMAEGKQSLGIKYLYEADEQQTQEGAIDPELKMKLFRYLRDTPYSDLALQYGTQAIRGGYRTKQAFVEYMEASINSPTLPSMRLLVNLCQAFQKLYPDEQKYQEKILVLQAKALVWLARREEAEQSQARRAAAREVLAQIKRDDVEIKMLRAQALETSAERLLAVEDALKDDPGNVSVVNTLLRYYMFQGAEDKTYYDKARKVIKGALRASEDNVNFQQMNVLLQEADPGNITAMRRQEIELSVLEKVKDPLDRSKHLAQYYQKLMAGAQNEQAAKDYLSRVREHLARAYELDGNDERVIMPLFDTLLNLQDWDEAERMISDLDKQKRHIALLLEGKLNGSQGQWVDAADRLERFLQEQPISPEGHLALARVYKQLGRDEEAIRQTVIATRQNRDYIAAHRMLALLLHEQNIQRGINNLDLQDIITQLQAIRTVLQTKGDDISMHRLAVIYNPLLTDYRREQLESDMELTESERGEIAQLIIDGEQGTVDTCRYLISQEPSNARNWQILARIYYQRSKEAKTEDQRQRLEAEAEKVYQEALEKNPDSSSLSSAYVNFLELTDRSVEGEKLLLEKVARSEGPAKQEARLRLSRAYLRRADTKSAQETLKTILAEDIENEQATVMLANLHVQQNNYVKAIELYERLRKMYDNESLMVRHIDVLLQAGQVKPGKELLEQLEAKYPDYTGAAILRGQLALQNANYAEAIAYADQISQKEPEQKSAYLLKGEALFYSGKLNAALDIVTKLRSTMRDNNNVGRDLLSRIYWALGRHDEAVSVLETALQYDPSSATFREKLISVLHELGRWEELEDLYAEEIERNPGTVRLYVEAGQAAMRLAEIQLKSGQRQLAIEKYRKALSLSKQGWKLANELNQQKGAAFEGLWAVLLKLNGYKEMLELTDQILAKEPDEPIIWARRAEALFQLKRSNEAMQTFEKALTIAQGKPNMADAVLGYATLVAEIDDLLPWARQKAEEQPEWVSVRMLLATLYRTKGDYHQEISTLEQVRPKLNAREALKTDTFLSIAYERVQDKDNAIKCYRRILAEDPTNASVTNNLAYSLVTTDGDIDEAVRLSEKACELSGNNPDFLDTYALTMLKKEEYVKAEMAVRRAIQQKQRQGQPVIAELDYHLGLALIGQERKDEAWDAMNSALEKVSENYRIVGAKELKKAIMEKMKEMSQ